MSSLSGAVEKITIWLIVLVVSLRYGFLPVGLEVLDTTLLSMDDVSTARNSNMYSYFGYQ